MTEDKAVFTAPRGNSPAFPCQDNKKQIWTGMNLRDYFALEAMNGMLENFKLSHLMNEEDTSFMDDLVKCSYMIANKMLSEREKFK